MRKCEECKDTLPAGREDTLCEVCRQVRILFKRTERERVTLCELPATFTERKN